MQAYAHEMKRANISALAWNEWQKRARQVASLYPLETKPLLKDPTWLAGVRETINVEVWGPNYRRALDPHKVKGESSKTQGGARKRSEESQKVSPLAGGAARRAFTPKRATPPARLVPSGKAVYRTPPPSGPPQDVAPLRNQALG